MTITTVGIDLAKNVFAVHCVDQNGRTVLVKPKVSRGRGIAPEWQMKREMLSPAYTTRWTDLPVARL